MDNNNINISSSERLETLQEIKRILTNEKSKDINCISLYDISRLIKDKNREYKKLIKYYEDMINASMPTSYYIKIEKLDYDKNELIINFSKYNRNKSEIIRLTKIDEDICVKNFGELSYPNELSFFMGNNISKVYDNLSQYSKCIKQYKNNIKSVNSNMLVNIDFNHIIINYKDLNNLCLNTFGNKYDNYNFICNSNNIISEIKDNEEEIFKRVFVKIEDCPEWCREDLYDIRQEQLRKEKIKKKILPFIKK